MSREGVKLEAQVKTMLLSITCQEPGDKLHINVIPAQDFCDDLSEDSITDSNHVRKLTDCLVMVLMYEFTHFFPLFWCSAGDWLP